NPHLPHNCTARVAAYTGTHDNPTTRGWYDALPDHQQEAVWRLQQPRGSSADAAPALVRFAWSSVAALAIAPVQDLLNLGDEARMNVPGRAGGNWGWRCTDDQLTHSVFEWLHKLTAASNRRRLGNSHWRAANASS